MVGEEFFDFFQSVFRGAGQQFQVSQAVGGVGGESYFIGEGCLAVPANKAVDGTAEIDFLPRVLFVVSGFAIDTVTQDRLEAGFFEQGELEQYQKGQHIGIVGVFIGVLEELEEVIEKLRMRVVIVGEFIQ